MAAIEIFILRFFYQLPIPIWNCGIIKLRYVPGKGIKRILWSSLNVWRPWKFSFRDFLSVAFSHLELLYHKAQIRARQKSHRASSLNVWRLLNYFYLEVFYCLHIPVATVDDLIEEILAELPDPVPEGQQFIDLDDQRGQ